MRAFVAVDLSEEIRARIASLQGEFAWLEEQGVVKFVEPHQAHQTVKFLGEIPETAVAGIDRALSALHQQPFELRLHGVGFFPAASVEKARNLRVIWVGIQAGEEQLRALQAEVEAKLYELGYPLERRFSAHITLGRVKKPLRSKDELKRVLAKITALREAEVGAMRVEEVKLKRSTLTPRGPIYDDLVVKRLVG